VSPRGLYGARALNAWIAAGGRPQHAPALHRLRAAWHGALFERNWASSQARIASAPAPQEPLFILGLWRSGTTVLHELLTATGSFVTPLTWQCFNPSTCFLTGPPERDASAARPMDAGRIAALGPQEDEFALTLLGEPSVYRGLIDPRRLRECGAKLWQDEEGELARWRDFVRGVAVGAPGARLLLKSPSHTFRLPRLQAAYPRARFLWIGRHTGEVLGSSVRMWRAMFGQYALWDCPQDALESFLGDMLSAYARMLEWALRHMTPERLQWIDFEALRTDARTVLSSALQFAHAGAHSSGELEEPIERALERVPVHSGERAALPEDPRVREAEALMSAVRARFGLGGRSAAGAPA